MRTIADCALDAVEPDLVEQAIVQGVRRGLFSRDDVKRSIRQARNRRPGHAAP
jgi:hypothetical protein